MEEFEERRKKTFWDYLDDVSKECDAKHKRLGKRVDELEAQADSHVIDIENLSTRTKALEDGPVEATKLRFSTGSVITIITATFILIGAGYGLKNSVVGRIDAMSVRLDQQAEQDKRERESTAKLLEERYLRSERQFDAFDKKLELMKYEQQRLREDMTRVKGSAR
jgi:hypothetical protein